MHSCCFEARDSVGFLSIPRAMRAGRGSAPALILMTTSPLATPPLAALPLTSPPFPLALRLVSVRRLPRALFHHPRHRLIDRPGLDVDGLRPDERLRQPR